LFEATTANGKVSIGASSISISLTTTDTLTIGDYTEEDTIDYSLAVVSALGEVDTLYVGKIYLTRGSIRTIGLYPPTPIPPAGCAPLDLDTVCDVNAPSPDDGDVLTYDSGTGQWVAAPASAGSAGNNIRDTYTCGENIVAYRAVKIVNGELFHCDATDAADADECVGISIQSASLGDTATIVFNGEITEPSWTWSQGAVYVGANGALTQSVSGLAFIQQIASSIAPTKVIVDVKLSIITI
jgi:hypothetical protein